jgi:hypothetical protein
MIPNGTFYKDYSSARDGKIQLFLLSLELDSVGASIVTLIYTLNTHSIICHL